MIIPRKQFDAFHPEIEDAFEDGVKLMMDQDDAEAERFRLAQEEGARILLANDEARQREAVHQAAIRYQEERRETRRRVMEAMHRTATDPAIEAARSTTNQPPAFPNPTTIDAARAMGNIRRLTEEELAVVRREAVADFVRERERLTANQNIKHAAVGQEDGRKAEALRLGTQLADMVAHSADGKVTPQMKSIAAGVRSALGVGSAEESRPGRAFQKDLVPGGLYAARGWSSGDFDWTYIGPVPGDPDRITIQRDGAEASVELIGDHGLAPYSSSSQVKFWHPTNWTEGTGVGVGTGKATSDAAAQAGLSMELPPEEEEYGFP